MTALVPNRPTFTQPSTSGLLSQKYGTLAETFVVRATSPRGNPVGQIRAQAVRQSDGLTVWDSGWTGNSMTQPIPSGVGPQALVQGTPNGPGISYFPLGGYANSITAPIYLASAAAKTLGAWDMQPFSLPIPTPYGAQAAGTLVKYAVATITLADGRTFVYVIGGASSLGYGAQSAVYYAQLNPDGSLAGPLTATSPLPIKVQDAAACGLSTIWGQYGLIVTGGSTDGTTPLANTYACLVNPSDGSLSSQFWVGGTSLGHARMQHQMISWGGYVWVIGGWGTSGAGVVCERQTPTSNFASYTWGDSQALPVPVYHHALCGVPNTANGQMMIVVLGGQDNSTHTAQTVVQWTTIDLQGLMPAWATTGVMWLPSADAYGKACVVVDGPTTTIFHARGNGTAVYAAAIDPAAHTIGSWSSGASSGALTTSQMGTGGSVALQPDGAQLLTFESGSVGVTAVANPAAGDTMAITVQVTDNVTGAVSPAGAVGVRYGDPPTVASLAVTPTNNGQPSISFVYVQGVGGRPIASYRLTVTDASNNVYADTGTIQGTPPTTWQPVMNPPLASGVAYTGTATVTSLDSAYPGSTVTGTATTTWTPTLSPPTTSAVSSTVSVPNNWTLSWTNGSGTTGNRVWARPHGSGAWTLVLSQAGSAGAGSAQLAGLLNFNKAYDLAVTAYNSSNAETAISVGVSNVTAVSTNFYLRDAVNAPTAAVRLNIKTGTFKTTIPENMTEHKPPGRPGVLVIADVMGLENGTFTCSTGNATDEAALKALLTKQTVLRLQAPDGREWNIRVTGQRPTDAPWVAGIVRDHAVTWVGQ